VPFISSDPHAWIRPYHEAVASREGFSHLAPSDQFELFVEAIAKDYPAKATQMREWNAATQWATLAVFANVVYSTPAPREVEFWRVAKDSRELRCLAVYMPTGINLRLMAGGDFRRTQLLGDGPAVQALAEQWQRSCRWQGGRESPRLRDCLCDSPYQRTRLMYTVALTLIESCPPVADDVQPSLDQRGVAPCPTRGLLNCYSRSTPTRPIPGVWFANPQT
jgi:hypothetical protein